MNRRFYFIVLAPLLLVAFVKHPLTAQQYYPKNVISNYLSHLNADKRFPLYTTYAATTSRSSFVVDEGYTFRYFIDSLAPDFITDNGADFGILFKLKDQIVYKTADMYRAPVITASYPDMVEFVCYPFEQLKATCTFLVYSSRIALLDWKITNLGNSDAEVELFQYVRNQDHLPYSAIEHQVQENKISFLQEVLPDDWTTAHNVPFADSLLNHWLPGFVPDKIALIDQFDYENNSLGYRFDTDINPARHLEGQITLPGDKRLRRNPPQGRLQAIVNGDDNAMITEQSLLWGVRAKIWDQNGNYHLETGHLHKSANTFTITAYDPVSGLTGSSSGIFGDITQHRADIALREGYPPPPANLRLEFDSPAILYLNWDAASPEHTYTVYRKYHGDADPVFLKIADGLVNPFFKNILKERRDFDYIVVAVDQNGTRSIHSEVVSTITDPVKTNFLDYARNIDTMPLWYAVGHDIHVLSFYKKIEIRSGKTYEFRPSRLVQQPGESVQKTFNDLYHVLAVDLKSFKEENEARYKKIKPGFTASPEQEALFWSAANMMTQCFLPAEGKSNFPYYVFSREPTWGWGHGGQVFHESLTMIAFARINPIMAMQSQRVFAERQYKSGYINYRTGPYLDEQIEHGGELTTSAPWYAWTNWEIYRITGDRQFLADMYVSSEKLYQFITAGRDKDGDGLCEWGGEAILESVRDGLVAVWDEVGYPSSFEALDLNCMLVKEAKSLEAMALELGYYADAARWKSDYERRSKLINEVFWDESTGFYYHVDKKDHDFSYQSADDLKRMEIIGFLPLWAGVCNERQAEKLVRHLTDPTTFWRPYGIPSLSAADSYYQPDGYWNGPVWVEWNYLIQCGLLQYHYDLQAKVLADKVASGMIEVLRDTHTLWELYHPDKPWGGHHQTYIWAGLINEMMQQVNIKK